MVTVCSVDGCHVTELDETATFHKFPRNSSLKRRWEAVVPLREISTDIPIVCNSHFLESDYRVCKGKKLLYTDSIPSIFPPRLTDEIKVNGEITKEDERHSADDQAKEHRTSRKRRRNTVFKKRKGIRYISTDSNTSDQSNVSKKSKDTIENNKNDLVNVSENRDVPLNSDVILTTNGTENSKDDSIKSNEQLMDLEATIPSFLILDVHQKIKQREANPISFNSHTEPAAQINSDSSVEKLEVSVDPSLLIMNEPVIEASIDLSQHDNTPERDKPPAPVIELLTSSDEDDVILQEPKYDLIEVSDETDEENVPLVTIKNKHKAKHKEPNFVADHKFNCPVCPFKTSNSEDQYVHYKTHQSVVSSCPFCDYITSESDRFREHVVTHDKETEIKCHLCPYVTKTVTVLLYHLDNHIQLKCEFCKYITIDRKILGKHERLHKKKYKCKVCPMSCSTKSGRNKHMLTHFESR